MFQKRQKWTEKKLKGHDMVLEKKKENFRGFRVFYFTLYRKPKTRKSRKVFFYFNVWQFCNLRFRNDKNELRQKLKGQNMFLEEKKKTSEVSEFSILPYTQNWKLGNLGKFSFTSSFDRFREILRERIKPWFFL